MKTAIANTTLAVTLLSGATVAHAADPVANPISNFLNTLQKIAAGPNAATQKEADTAAAPNPVAPGQVVGNSESDDIMKSVAMENGAMGTVSPSTCQYHLNDDGKILLAQKTGKFMDAGLLAKIRAANIAACSLKGVGLTLAQGKDEVGHLLAISSINLSRAGMVIDDVVLRAKYAKTLLKLNEQANQSWIADLDKTFWPKGPQADAQAFATLTAKDVVAKYKDNTFAFRRTYLNKTLQIKGRVDRITGTDKSASILLDGETKKSSNDKGWQDSIRCEIKNAEAMDDAARISSGANVTVQGIVVQDLLPGVALEDCRLVR